MDPITLESELSELFESHKVPFHVEKEWIVPFGKLPAIRATWFPREESGLLEVEVLLDDERIINECFAGIGGERSGMVDALQNFCVNSFHVLLASFWDTSDPNQVMIESWPIYGEAYTAYIGNFGTRASDNFEAVIPENLFEVIEASIKSEEVTQDISWFRCFICCVSGEFTFEALRNNEVWEDGLTSMKSIPWEKTEHYYSVRNFLVLRKNA